MEEELIFDITHGDDKKPRGLVVLYTPVISRVSKQNYRACFGFDLNPTILESARFYHLQKFLREERPFGNQCGCVCHFIEDESFIDKHSEMGWDIYKSRFHYELDEDSRVEGIDQLLENFFDSYMEDYKRMLNQLPESANGDMDDVWKNI